MRVVIDASVMGPMLLPDEDHDRFEDLLELLSAGNAIVPQHWPLEIANLSRTAIKRGRLDADECAVRLEDLRRFAVPVDDQTILQLWQVTMSLALKHDLTPYDAAYLELARRRKLPLFTHDQRLAAAGAAEGVATF